MTGKLADTVMSVRNGEQIARKYQPVVYNPSTPAQIATRAKLKLMSQLSTVFAPVIAMPKQGSISSRNMFFKENYVKMSYANNEADINLTDISLTKSVVSLPEVIFTRGTGYTIDFSLVPPVSELSRVVYAIFMKTTDDERRYVSSLVATEPGAGSDYKVSSSLLSSIPYVVYAYGVRDNTEASKAYFGNLEVPTAESIAKLVTSRTLSESDITITETKAVEVPIPSGN